MPRAPNDVSPTRCVFTFASFKRAASASNSALSNPEADVVHRLAGGGGLLFAGEVDGELRGERRREIEDRRLAQAHARKRCSPGEELLAANGGKPDDLRIELERSLRVLHPEHDVVDVHGLNLRERIAQVIA